MKINYHRAFKKAFKKLPTKIQKKAMERTLLFLENRKSPLLKDHALIGNMSGQRSFSVTGDCRVIYQEEENGELTFLFLDIGAHTQVYE